MGFATGSSCFATLADAASSLCGSNYPQTSAAPDGTPIVVSCAGTSTAGVLTLKTAAALTTTGATTGTWLLMNGTEGTSYAGIPSGTVRFGAGSTYLQATKSGNFTCNSAAFGGDPAPGVAKHCDYLQMGDTYAYTKTVTPAFGACDPSAKYTDLYAAFALCLGALAGIWAVKSFTLKLLANQ